MLTASLADLDKSNPCLITSRDRELTTSQGSLLQLMTMKAMENFFLILGWNSLLRGASSQEHRPPLVSLWTSEQNPWTLPLSQDPAFFCSAKISRAPAGRWAHLFIGHCSLWSNPEKTFICLFHDKLSSHFQVFLLIVLCGIITTSLVRFSQTPVLCWVLWEIQSMTLESTLSWSFLYYVGSLYVYPSSHMIISSPQSQPNEISM